MSKKSKKSNSQSNTQSTSRLSLVERIIAYTLAFIVIITLIILVLYPRTMSSEILAIVRFLAALCSSLSAYLFLGEVQIQGKIRKTAVRASGGFALFILVLLLFFYGIPSSENSDETIGLDITLNPLSKKITHKNLINVHSSCPSKVFPILYSSYYINSSILEIKPESEYLSLVSQNSSEVDLTNFCDFRFISKFPELSIKAINNKSKAIFLSEVIIRIKTEEKDERPILRLNSSSYSPNEFEIINDGWGEIINPKISIDLSKIKTCNNNTIKKNINKKIIIEHKNFIEKTNIKINKFPNSLKNDIAVCANVNIVYSTSDNLKHTSKLKTILWLKKTNSDYLKDISNNNGTSNLKEPSYRYSLFLDPEVKTKTISLPISHVIQPKDTDNFTVEISTNKTAKFSMSFSFRTVSGLNLPGESLVVSLFVPRSQGNSCQKDKTIDLLTRNIVEEIIYNREYDTYNKNITFADINVYKELFNELKKNIKKDLNFKQINNIKYLQEYIRNFVNLHQEHFCGEFGWN